MQTFGKVNQGVPSGLHLTIEGKSPNIRFNTYFTNGALDLTGVMVATGTDNQHLPLNKRLWAVDDGSDNNEPTTYEVALNKIKTYISQKSEPSIDFDVFKAYLEALFSSGCRLWKFIMLVEARSVFSERNPFFP